MNSIFFKGLSSSGFVQMNLPLKANKTYFSTIRGVTNEGKVLETSSDGFTVDETPPVIGVDRFVSIIFITLCTIHLQIT